MNKIDKLVAWSAAVAYLEVFGDKRRICMFLELKANPVCAQIKSANSWNLKCMFLPLINSFVLKDNIDEEVTN